MTDIATHSQLSALIRHRRSIKPVDMDVTRDVERGLLTQVLEDATWIDRAVEICGASRRGETAARGDDAADLSRDDARE
jgi:hypothetical protein